jgi:hypothetical protein
VGGYALQGGDSDAMTLEDQAGSDAGPAGGAVNTEVPSGAFGEWNSGAPEREER